MSEWHLESSVPYIKTDSEHDVFNGETDKISTNKMELKYGTELDYYGNDFTVLYRYQCGYT